MSPQGPTVLYGCGPRSQVSWTGLQDIRIGASPPRWILVVPSCTMMQTLNEDRPPLKPPLLCVCVREQQWCNRCA